MDYTRFIQELRLLQAEAPSLLNDPQTHEAPKFRKWRHDVTTLISAIESRGYSIDCNISSRRFFVASYGPVTKSEQIASYNRDLQDTINELSSVINFFDKFGDPRAETKQIQPPVPAKEEADTTTLMNTSRSETLKEKFESHPVIWGSTLLIVGFVSGFGARGYFSPEKVNNQSARTTDCRVEGADRLAESHHIRVEALQKQLLKLEGNASDRILIQSDQDKYKEAANRVRQDIVTENANYQAAIQLLSKKCQ